MQHQEKKPRKHLELGINLNERLAVSRQILEFMNRLGRCAGYHTVEEVETALTVQSKKGRKISTVWAKTFMRIRTWYSMGQF